MRYWGEHRRSLTQAEHAHLNPCCENHDQILAGHLGLGKTLARLQRQYTWPHTRAPVVEYVKSCLICNKRKAVGGSKAPLQPMPSVERVWERIERGYSEFNPRKR